MEQEKEEEEKEKELEKEEEEETGKKGGKREKERKRRESNSGNRIALNNEGFSEGQSSWRGSCLAVLHHAYHGNFWLWLSQLRTLVWTL
jgi:hypothetical protein